MFRKDDLPSNVTRQAYVDRSLLTLLWHCDLDTLKEFFSRIVVDAIDVLKSRFTKVYHTLLLLVERLGGIVCSVRGPLVQGAFPLYPIAICGHMDPDYFPIATDWQHSGLE